MNLIYDHQLLANICLKYEANFLGVFGSQARGDAELNSDIDLLVRFTPTHQGGLFELSAMRDDLEKVFHKKVDLLTDGFISKYFKDEVLAETKPIYDKT